MVLNNSCNFTITQYRVLVGSASNVIGQLSDPTDGQALIGVAGGSPVWSRSVQLYQPIITKADSATLDYPDANTFQKCTKGTAMVITVPENNDVAFPIGTEINVYQQGAGQVSFTPGGITTINSQFGNLKIAAQYSGASLKKTDTNVWELFGNLTA